MKKGVSYSFAYNQLDYVGDESGNLLIDFVGCVENFETDIRKVLNTIGIEQEVIPRDNSSTHKHYSEFYTPEIEMIVREKFKGDIEFFGYEFERPHAPRVPS
jgi:chondroitin 4-sulfotransferase 11